MIKPVPSVPKSIAIWTLKPVLICVFSFDPFGNAELEDPIGFSSAVHWLEKTYLSRQRTMATDFKLHIAIDFGTDGIGIRISHIYRMP